jgi:hypothetical protein
MKKPEPWVRLLMDEGLSADGSGRKTIRLIDVAASPGALPPECLARLEAAVGVEYPADDPEPSHESEISADIYPAMRAVPLESKKLQGLLRRIASQGPKKN